MITFEKIYRQYKDKMFRYTYNYSRNSQEQEELFQEIFLNIYTGMKSFKKKSSLKTYIYTIARYTCIKHINKDKRDKKLIEKLEKFYEEEFEKNPYEILEMSENMAYFLNIIRQIEEEYREVFYFAEIEHLKYKKISEILNVPVGTVKSRLNRAKKKLMEIIKNNREGGINGEEMGCKK